MPKPKKDPNGLTPEQQAFLADIATVNQGVANAALTTWQQAQQLKRKKKKQKGLSILELIIALVTTILILVLFSSL